MKGPMLDHEFRRYRVAVWFSRKVLVSTPILCAAYLYWIEMTVTDSFGVLIFVVLQNWFIWRLLDRAI